MRLFLFLFGYRVLSVPTEKAAALFEICRIYGITLRRIERRKEEICFVSTLYIARKLAEMTARHGVNLTVVREAGVPFLFRQLLRRPGMALGVLCALLLLTGARLFLWDVEIMGNESITAEELREELAAAGLAKGSFLPRLNADAVAASLRQGDKRLAYVAVNLQGNVAKVQVKEAAFVPETRPTLPANLVARCDGVITMPLIYEGECLVKEGDVVRAGQLLAGGLIDTENNGVRVTRAAGQVLARTVHTYTVYVPFVHEEKVYTGRVGREISLLFFSLDRKVLKTTGNIKGSCDIIETVKWLPVGDGRSMPVGYAEKCYAEYTTVTARYTAEEAYAKAYAELADILAAESAGRTMLSRTVETAANAEGITLVCTVIAEEDIAATVELAPPA